MAIQGLRGTGNFATDERPKNWREAILHLFPNGNVPLTALTNQMKKESTDDPEFNWWEKLRPARRLELHATSGDLTLVNTTIVLKSGEDARAFTDGAIFLVEHTGEKLLVSGDPTLAESFTVVRGALGTTIATLDANASGINPNLLWLGNAFEEASSAPTGVSYDPAKKYNYTQIFRDTLEMSRTAQKTKLRTGDQVKEAKRETLEIHAQGIERALWLGTRFEGTRRGKQWRATGGFKYFLDNYQSGARVKNAKTDYSAGVTMDGLEGYLYEIFRYGSSEKMAFCGNRALLTIQQIVRKNSNVQITSGIKEFGMNVMRLDCPFGSLVLKNHPMFNEVTGGTNTTAYYGMEAWMAVVDMSNLVYRPLKDSDTKFEKDLQDNGLDGMKAGYISELGMEFRHPETHYLITAMHAGKVD